jgi:PHD/YefM family antitoxin component YafN of YafNO toxin-antitoxin module
MQDVQYVVDAEGNPTAVLVPIDLWREISSERETAHLLRSPAMRVRLLAARDRTGGTPLDDILSELDIEPPEAGSDKLR